ncbi:GATA zinc finger-domain-containing protein, partial [Amylostereum chailletii]
QSMAEADMELIRTKRATTTGAAGVSGQQKTKYRKRSRATPPGKCHSCNIRETPEWRRGPDGARTLCNACGLHYAKLMRKKDKNSGPPGSAGEVVDMESVRASVKAGS